MGSSEEGSRKKPIGFIHFLSFSYTGDDWKSVLTLGTKKKAREEILFDLFLEKHPTRS